MSRVFRGGGVIAVVAAVLTMASACAASSGPQDGTGRVRVVASTDVYGDIAAQIGGARVDVRSIISDPDTDPHSYEANAQAALALSKAQVVIENGGGYDDFVDRLLKGNGQGSARVLNAVQISGHTAAGGALNEHVWYDFPTIGKLVGRLVTALSAADPPGAATFEANAARFTAELRMLIAEEASIKAGLEAEPGSATDGIVVTEPVPLYLTSACGLVDRTPAAFSEAIEEGTDAPPRILQQTLTLLGRRAVALLAYNEQTSSAQTERVLAAAKAAGVPVVAVRETLPADRHYGAWMADNLAAIKRALAG